MVVFWTAHLFESRYRLLLWLDVFALSVAVPAGVGGALEGGFSPIIVVIMGVVTGTFGGLIPVTGVDGRLIGDGAMGPMTRRRHDLYEAAIDAAVAEANRVR